MVINCPNCGAPVRHLTGGDICEYCGSSFPLSVCRPVPSMSIQVNGASVFDTNDLYNVATSINQRINRNAKENLQASVANAVNTITDYDNWQRFNIDAGTVFEWI